MYNTIEAAEMRLLRSILKLEAKEWGLLTWEIFCTILNSDLPVTIHIESHQLPFQKCWSICIINKLPDATPTVFSTN